MSIELTTEQLRAAQVRIIDPETNCEYVVVRSELFDRLKGVLEDDDAGPAVPGIGRAGS